MRLLHVDSILKVPCSHIEGPEFWCNVCKRIVRADGNEHLPQIAGGMPIAGPIAYQGAYDASTFNAAQYQIFNLTAPVTLTNPTSATVIWQPTTAYGQQGYTQVPVPFAPNFLNRIGVGFEYYVAGIYNLGATSTVIFTVTLGGVTIATWTTGSQSNTGASLLWSFSGYAFCQSVAGPGGGNGSLMSHGNLQFALGATTAASVTSYNDTNTAAITNAAMNLSLPLQLQFLVNLGSGNSSSTITAQIGTVDFTQ
jgi:hypothetical protein